jgi:hypothetical protein
VTLAPSVATQASEAVRDVEGIRTLVHELRGQIGAKELTSGHWFTRLVAIYLRRRAAQGQGARGVVVAPPKDRIAQVDAAIRLASLETTLAGTTTAALATSATVAMVEVQWLAGLAAVPLVGAAMTSEMIVRALTDIKMTCDLAELFGVRFDPNDPAEVVRLYALAFRTEEYEEPGDPGRALIERLVHLDPHEAAGAIGLKMLVESVVRNGVPFAGIAVSAWSNWQQTRRVGEMARGYLRMRRALDDALTVAERDWSESFDLVLEGIWFVFITKGRVTPEEAAVLAYLVRRRKTNAGEEIIARFVRDESDWLRRLGQVPSNARASMLRALEIAACADKALTQAEEDLLQRAAQALQSSYERIQLTAMLEQLNTSEVLIPPSTATVS